MGHHCDEQPATVSDLIFALQQLDPDLEIYETWDEVPGWFDVDKWGSTDVVWLGTRKCGEPCRNRDY